jgi:hypothetical protein
MSQELFAIAESPSEDDEAAGVSSSPTTPGRCEIAVAVVVRGRASLSPFVLVLAVELLVVVVDRPPGTSDRVEIAVDSGLVDVVRLCVPEEVEAIGIGGDNTVIWRGGDGGKITTRGVGVGAGVTNTARGEGVGSGVGTFTNTGVGAQTQTSLLQSQPKREHEMMLH